MNVAIRGIFMNATLKAAIHLGNNHDVNLRHVKNSFLSYAGQLFGDIEKLVSGQTETTGVNLIDSKDLKCISTSLLHSRAHQYADAKVYVFSDSVLCLGKMGKEDGARVEDSPRIHDSGYPQRDSEKDGRITVRSNGFQRQDHLHDNV